MSRFSRSPARSPRCSSASAGFAPNWPSGCAGAAASTSWASAPPGTLRSPAPQCSAPARKSCPPTRSSSAPTHRRSAPTTAAIILSHRGTKQSSYDALDLARARGAITIAVTSLEPGPRITAADALIHTCPLETSAAYTVSYTTILTALAMLDAAMNGGSGEAGSACPGLAAEVLALEPAVQAVVERHARAAPLRLRRLGRQPRQRLRGRRSKLKRPAAPTARASSSSSCCTAHSAISTPTACWC